MVSMAEGKNCKALNLCKALVINKQKEVNIQYASSMIYGHVLLEVVTLHLWSTATRLALFKSDTA